MSIYLTKVPIQRGLMHEETNCLPRSLEKRQYIYNAVGVNLVIITETLNTRVLRVTL